MRLRGSNFMEHLRATVLFRLGGIQVGARRPAAQRHQMVLGGVHGDPIEPGVKGTVATETGQRAPGFDKGFLGDVLDLVVVTHIAADQREDTLLVLEHQHLEGALIAALGFLDQLFV